MAIKKLPFKERYFFLFDDYLLEVSLPTRNGKYKLIRYAPGGHAPSLPARLTGLPDRSKLDLKTLAVSSWEKEKERELKESLPQNPTSAAAVSEVRSCGGLSGL